MGWKGTVRSVRGAYRAAERDSQRRHRELQRREKEFLKMQALEQAAYEVEVYENRIELLLSVHKECGTAVDWHQLAANTEPERPIASNRHEIEAKAKEANYKPSLIDRMFGLERKRRTRLAVEIQNASAKDEESNKKAAIEWKLAFDEWKSDAELSKRVLGNVPEAKIDAIKQLNPFTDIAELGSSLSFAIGTSGVVECSLSIHGSDVVPSEVKTLLSSGRLSVKKMPVSKFNELFQDYVCSCVLRAANELFHILPDEMVVVTASDTLLNKATGNMEEMPILSAAIPRATLSCLNMQNIDPSDSMGNFVHNMAFKKTSGFSVVERINPSTLARLAKDDS